MKGNTLHIIGMSPGNSYFKDSEVEFLVTESVKQFGKVAVMIADVPAVSTYMAYGYKENRARRDKAIPQGNLLKNRVKRVMEKHGYNQDQVNVVDWANDVELNKDYQDSYKKVRELYDSTRPFKDDVRKTTKSVLLGSGREIDDIESAVDIAVHYLLSEIAFLEWAHTFFHCDSVTYVYHHNWLVYENYIAGKYDGCFRKHSDFLLKQNPYETYVTYWGAEDIERNILRIGFAHYPPALIFDSKTGEKSGIFYDLIQRVSKEHELVVEWVEQTGYGVVVKALREKRFDVFGSPLWEIPERKGEVTFSDSLYESDVFAWKRKDYYVDETARVVVKEDDISHSIAKEEYPTKRYVYVPQLADTVDLLRFVLDEKGEITFVEEAVYELLDEREKEELEKVSTEPIKTFNNSFAFNNDSSSLVEIFNKEIQNWKITKNF